MVTAAASAHIIACGGNSGSVNPPPPKITSNLPGPSLLNVTLVSSDPFTNTTSQHATEVEPSMASFGSTIVATFQSGRFLIAGSSDIGFATSHNAGATWLSGFLPATTHYSAPSGSFDSVSDPVVAYDAKHAVWLISVLPVFFSTAAVPGALVSRSADGVHWTRPVWVAPGQDNSDKEWIACDNTATSPFYGHCYLQWDDPSAVNVIHVSTSSDGGVSWSVPTNTGGSATGIGGQPVVQPNGTVIIPIDDALEANVLAFSSHDGGVTWSTPVEVSPIILHFINGNLRSGPLPSAAMDAAGTVYLVWQDCRFRASCASNDIVLSTSSDGVHWSAPARVPIDPTTSAADHFIPGVAVAPGTSGSSAQLGLTYYTYANTGCVVSNCALSVAYVASNNGGTSWSAPTHVVGPMSPVWLAQTDQGFMVADYIATTIVGTQPIGIFAVAEPPLGSALDEAMYTSKLGVLPARAFMRASSFGERPVPGAHSDRYVRLRPP